MFLFDIGSPCIGSPSACSPVDHRRTGTDDRNNPRPRSGVLLRQHDSAKHVARNIRSSEVCRSVDETLRTTRIQKRIAGRSERNPVGSLNGLRWRHMIKNVQVAQPINRDLHRRAHHGVVERRELQVGRDSTNNAINEQGCLL